MTVKHQQFKRGLKKVRESRWAGVLSGVIMAWVIFMVINLWDYPKRGVKDINGHWYKEIPQDNGPFMYQHYKDCPHIDHETLYDRNALDMNKYNP